MRDPTVSKNGARKRKVPLSGVIRILDRENLSEEDSPKLKKGQ